MRVSKNRQLGFIKKCTSTNIIQPHYQPQYQTRDNESFSKFDQQFSSFCYKLPHDETQNQFSLFVFNQQDQPLKISKNMKQSNDLNRIKQNDYKLSNKNKHQVREYDEKVLKEEDQYPQQQMRQTHIKFNTKKQSPTNHITANYYSATTTYAKTNKITADNNPYQKQKPSNQYHNRDTQQNDLRYNEFRQNYMKGQSAHTPGIYRHKQVGKLRKTSKERMTERHPIQCSKKYQEDMFENGEEYYKEKELKSQRHGQNTLKRVKSNENIFSFKNLYTDQYANKNHETYQTHQYKMSKQQMKLNNQKFPFHHSNPYSKQILHQQPPKIVKRNYKEVSQSSVLQSEPSFLKERLEEVQRRKLQLLEKKRELQEMKRKSFQRMYQQNFQVTRQVENISEKELETKNTKAYKSRKSEHLKKGIKKVQDISELNSSSDRNSSSQTSSQRQQSSQNSESLSDDQNQSSGNQKLHSNHPSSSQVEHNYHQHEQSIKYHQQIYYQPSSPLAHIPKSPKNHNFTSNFINTNIHSPTTNKKSSIQIQQKKTSPLQIIKQIQKRSQQLKKQELKEMYQKQGISVAKGGITFEINTKDFVYPEKDTDPQNITNSPNQNTQNKQTMISRESVKNNSNKNQKKFNTKEELKKRRQLAKSYDRYTRNRIFGAF